jgi:hypothetical protein
MGLDIVLEIVIRTIEQFVVEILFVGIFWPEWGILRGLTPGSYPSPQSPQPGVCCPGSACCIASGRNATLFGHLNMKLMLCYSLALGFSAFSIN